MNPELIENIPRLHTALAEWLACLVYILQLPHRRRGAGLWGRAAGFLAVQAAFLYLTDDVPLALWMPCMAVAAAGMLTMIAVCGRTPLAEAGYLCVRAFMLAEFAASLEWQLYTYIVQIVPGWGVWLRVLVPAVVFAGVYLLLYWLESRRRADYDHLQITPRELGAAAAIAVTAFFMSNLSYAWADSPFSSSLAVDIFNTRTLVDLGGVAILYAYHVQRAELRIKYELNAIQNILQTQYAQYRQSRESIDLINRKYHDLKHQIAALRAEPDPAQRNAWLDEMEADIRVYEAQNKTGNPVLDTLFTGKSLLCQKHGITLTVVADGSALNFMDSMDLCTIFGNALDNAIDGVRALPDRDKRLIHLSVSRQKSFVLIRVENYFEGQLQFENGLPRSTKGDAAYHGFGIKSIRYSVRKYGGQMDISTRDNWFELKLLIPVPEPSPAG